MNNYIVYKVYKDNYDKQILFTNLTREEAQLLVQNAPSDDSSMLVFDKQS